MLDRSFSYVPPGLSVFNCCYSFKVSLKCIPPILFPLPWDLIFISFCLDYCQLRSEHLLEIAEMCAMRWEGGGWLLSPLRILCPPFPLPILPNPSSGWALKCAIIKAPLDVKQVYWVQATVRNNFRAWATGSCGKDVSLGMAWDLWGFVS